MHGPPVRIKSRRSGHFWLNLTTRRDAETYARTRENNDKLSPMKLCSEITLRKLIRTLYLPSPPCPSRQHESNLSSFFNGDYVTLGAERAAFTEQKSFNYSIIQYSSFMLTNKMRLCDYCCCLSCQQLHHRFRIGLPLPLPLNWWDPFKSNIVWLAKKKACDR